MARGFFHADILPGLFDPEDGGDMFRRNVDWLSTDYTALYPITAAMRTLNPTWILFSTFKFI
jgi:hypothetical protein